MGLSFGKMYGIISLSRYLEVSIYYAYNHLWCCDTLSELSSVPE